MNNVGIDIKDRTQTPSAPFNEVRRDCIEHWPNYEKQRRLCKMPNCKFQSLTKCTKCSVYQCYNNDRNYFVHFHCS
jgi:hypothetical protein